MYESDDSSFERGDSGASTCIVKTIRNGAFSPDARSKQASPSPFDDSKAIAVQNGLFEGDETRAIGEHGSSSEDAFVLCPLPSEVSACLNGMQGGATMSLEF